MTFKLLRIVQTAFSLYHLFLCSCTYFPFSTPNIKKWGILYDICEITASTHPLNVVVAVQSCVSCPAQASVSTTSSTTSSPCATQTRAWTSTSTASSAVWSGSKPCSVSQWDGVHVFFWHLRDWITSTPNNNKKSTFPFLCLSVCIWKFPRMPNNSGWILGKCWFIGWTIQKLKS